MKQTKPLILLAFVFIIGTPSLAQQCNCALTFQWAKEAFEQNDAGFQYIIDQKGTEAYQIHNSAFQNRIKTITNADTCALAIRQWAKFFRVGHFNFTVNKAQAAPAKQIASNAIGRYNSYARDYDTSTVYLRIPTFSSNYKTQIDSVIHANINKIVSKKNLIIDITDNGGGDDRSYSEILPILYTNPIVNVSVEYLSTPHNNQIWEQRLQQPGLSETTKAAYAGYVDKLHANLGKFVRLFNNSYTTTYDVKYPMPQNVAIIINGNNGSTAEQFLLAAKQSKKVKLFGTTTMGELDISNMYNITSPDGQFTMGYCLSKSLRIPDNTIDNKGIAPDFYISREIPKENWVSYVAGVIKNW